MMYAVLGMSIMVSANNLLAVYIGIEMQSLALYVMAAWNRDSLRASEAGLKYFVLGALSSGLLLYGISMVYGFTGSLSFDRIAEVVGEVVMGPFGEITDQWQQVIIVFAVLSMFVGAIGALAQTNIKRLMAYSSIANMGYALVALAAGTQGGVVGVLTFMSIYVITTIGVFACILQMRIRNGMVEQITDLAGLSKTNSGLAVILTILMFSLAGIPPLLGFFGKLFAFWPAMEAGLTWLVVLALLASVIGAFYYIRIIKIMWGDASVNDFVEAPSSLRWMTSFVALLILPLMILPFTAGPARNLIAQAANSLF